jgi:hypothetical protein
MLLETALWCLPYFLAVAMYPSGCSASMRFRRNILGGLSVNVGTMAVLTRRRVGRKLWDPRVAGPVSVNWGDGA